MNSNDFIRQNYMGAVLLIVLLIFVYLMFGRSEGNYQAESQQPTQSFLTDNAGTNLTGVPGANYSDGLSTAPAVQQPQTGAQTGQARKEAIEWCVLIDGANHIPDLFGEGIDNGGGGTNWHSYANDDPRGPHGVFSEGGKMVFFVKKSYLDQHGTSPLSAQLKSNSIGWNNEPAMSWANIAGEQALVYVK